MIKNTVIALLMLLCFAGTVMADLFDEWNLLDKSIRDNTIDRKTARTRINELHRKLHELSTKSAGTGFTTFPLRGYGPAAIGEHGRGYLPRGYNFYDGNRHGGHPAHDIFIKDRNQDTLDDRTGKPVEVLSCCDGVVIAVNREWRYPNAIRGGIYVWIFSPDTDRYYYYAHLGEVTVSPGTAVKAGDTLGTLGRSGKNAYRRRSPTHVHFMCLDYADGGMTPRNTLQELRKAVSLP